MAAFRIQTLQQKTVLFVLVPMFLFLTAVGWGGLIFAKKSLLTQWGETAVANLQKAAHLVDMRLGYPKNLLQRLNYTSGTGMAHLTLRYTLQQLESIEGVADVRMKRSLPDTTPSMPSMTPSEGEHHGTELWTGSSPQYQWKSGNSTVTLFSTFYDDNGVEGGIIEVEILISDLVDQLAKSEWWKSNRTLLVDMEGNIIAHSSYENDSFSESGEKRFGDHDLLEKKTLAEIQKKPFGTIFGEGNPPEKIIGYYRLSDVPWYMVVVASGDRVLQPIAKFSLYYGLLFTAAIIIVIGFIKSMITKITGAVQKLSVAAEDLANGVFSRPLSIQSHDEIGELTKSFNTMTAQIKKGVALQKAMGIAREVQQNFLPDARYLTEAIEYYGSCKYCQETGGDFFDFVTSKYAPGKVGVVVGDVVGHGVGAALLMASIRAMVRTRNEQPGTIAEIMTDVNRVLCRDTAASSNFVTLFYVMVDPREKTLEWVRAGHDPGVLIYPDRREYHELKGKGVAMGLDENVRYESNVVKITNEKQLVVIGSDGAWEAQNGRGEMFGKQRVLDILLQNGQRDPETIINLINHEIDIFLEGAFPQDDITFAIIKINGETLPRISMS